MYNILIVEDEEIIRKGLSYSLDWVKYGFNIAAEAANGKEALELVEKYRPDLILLDISMPIMNGFELLKEIYGSYDFEVIILTGYSEFDYAKKSIQYGVTDYLLKPIDDDELVLAIEKVKKKLDKKGVVNLLFENFGEKVDVFSIKDYDNKDNYKKSTKLIINHIKENYKEKINNEKLIEVTDMGKTYINNEFKKDTGKTINNFVNEYRIIKSIELMKEGNIRVSKIFEKVGFSNYSYFIEVFKRYTGLTPVEFNNKYI